MKPQHLQALKESVDYLEKAVENKDTHFDIYIKEKGMVRQEWINREGFLEFCMEVVITDLISVIEDSQEV